MCVRTWASKSDFLAAAYGHREHAKGFSPVCVRTWASKSDFFAAAYGHREHAKGFSPVCVRTYGHSAHAKGFILMYNNCEPSYGKNEKQEKIFFNAFHVCALVNVLLWPVCVRTWASRVDLSAVANGHSAQTKGLSPVWVRKCLVKVAIFVAAYGHSAQTKDFPPVCFRMCLINWDLKVDTCGHKEHPKGFILMYKIVGTQFTKKMKAKDFSYTNALNLASRLHAASRARVCVCVRRSQGRTSHKEQAHGFTPYVSTCEKSGQRARGPHMSRQS